MNSLIESLRDKLSSILSTFSNEKYNLYEIEILFPENPEFGDISLNYALQKAKKEKKNPREIAENLRNLFLNDPNSKTFFKDIKIAGPGFINFYFSDDFLKNIIKEILVQNNSFGNNHSLKDKKVLIEFVSANPTGPLTIAHGRQAVVGDSLAGIMNFCGAKADKEYYLNDKGVQITTLGKSVFLRYLELFGKEIQFPEECYQGDYIKDIAQNLKNEWKDKYLNISEEEGADIFKKPAYQTILDDINKDLKEFKVDFDNYFSEKSLEENNKIEECIDYLTKKNHIYKKEGALWFESTKFGDDKDRVIKKSNNEYTYLSSDIPYHHDKLKRGYDMLINILGPDHHGYIARLEAAVEALGYDRKALRVLIVQLSTLYRGDVQLRMSTRKGEFITMRQLIDEVGVDAARYFYASKKTDSHLDFDLELAKKHTPDNPVFYVQYAAARISSIMGKAEEKNINIDNFITEAINISLLSNIETKLIKLLFRFPDIVADAAKQLEPQKITSYLEKIAQEFQSYYSSGDKIISDEKEKTIQKLIVCKIFKQVIVNGLTLLGINSPERM